MSIISPNSLGRREGQRGEGDGAGREAGSDPEGGGKTEGGKGTRRPGDKSGNKVRTSPNT